MSETNIDARVDSIVDALIAVANQDFAARAPVGDDLDAMDAIATGINMMAEELEGQVVSRRELEAAYASLQQAQATLVHTGKLAAIGQLASGVIHEVSNPASWSALALELARKRVHGLRKALGPTPDRDSTEILVMVDEVAVHIERASEGLARILAIVGDLRMFARAEAESTELVFLDEVVRATCNLLEPSIRAQASVVCVEADVHPVRGSHGRLGQVVTNLIVNAAQALGRENRKGRIEVHTLTEGGYIVLRVDDNGPGVPEELRSRVFDPFFTTDPQGLGLGLSLVSEIVTRHGGDVTVGSSELGGARFQVRLPLART